MAADIPAELIEIIIEDYQAGKGLKKIEKELGIPHEKIRRILTDHGVPIRGAPKNIKSVTPRERFVRIRTVANWIVNCITSRYELLEKANDPKGPYRWAVAISTMDRYIIEAKALLRESDEDALEDLRAVAKAQFRQLWQETSDPKVRLSILDRRLKFEGLDAPTKTNVSGALRVISLQDLSDDELEALANGI